MNVIYDYQIMIGQKYGGISRYFYELIQRFSVADGISPRLYCVFNDNAYFRGNRRSISYSRVRGRRSINKMIIKFMLSFSKYDIFHPTYYDPYFLDYNKGKLVLTVYDMIHELMPYYFSQEDSTVENKKKLIYKADKIIAISENTKRDILKLYPDIDQNKISVIYIGSNFKPIKNNKLDCRFPQRYVLFVGTRRIYKNYLNFYESMKPILQMDSSLHLVCAGGGAFTQEEIDLQKDNIDRIHQVNIDDVALSYAYSHAQCFVFPSLYEGFGIPTLEAFACNCPVVLSNASSMPEVGGDAVVYINPYDIADMTKKIKMVLDNEDMRKDLIKKGKEQLKKFDWDKIATQTLDCYREVIEGM
ncbi:glycosyltransferase family 4 protein [Kineothrix sp. MSJ-39]|uniref:glycosyltransferase family 4 protein n=1 Tax=Kineothrix sp. MSJ-39 TaxID=2841533 RepID=UPI001C112970|nr:glycosyltransferase family 1 protein [Kineothrix sp. MSJ-39]MBU5430219.1 glycosyltransferase family 4 protein [Kineothrix sp. MSJ-39]